MSEELHVSLRQKLRGVLGSVPIFELLDTDELEPICEGTAIQIVDPGTLVVEAGSRGDSMMIILEGQVKVFLTSPDGREIILSHMTAGDFFGEMSIIDPGPRSASVRAVERTALALLEQDVFVRLVQGNPDVLLKMSATLCRRLRRADEKIADLAFRDVSGRLANYLVGLAEKEGVPDGGMHRVRLPSHKEIAALLGTSRETVSRAFSQFREAEFVIGQDRCWLVHCGKLRRLT